MDVRNVEGSTVGSVYTRCHTSNRSLSSISSTPSSLFFQLDPISQHPVLCEKIRHRFWYTVLNDTKQNADWRLALLGSSSFEAVQGNELGLFMHIRGASAIWKSIYRPNGDSSSSHSSNMIVKGYTWNVLNNEITNLESSMSGDCMETITPCTRLSIDDSRVSDLQGTSATRIPSPSLQTPSELFFKARDSLFDIIINMESFFRRREQIHHSLPRVLLPPIVAEELFEI